ncbi:sodium ion-translocating decarboxylase subunit beta [Herbinix luporum]|uniref:Sodium ion-translocating decarboxylase subunit beta n=1 Tax=Herbinix luporum TaxID=1679721 RepID=A0A0K8J3F7_9FIRM|nr:sodium ion-translocating decarboxylase subunit beta [Herbinix luporum]CUH92030.1 hypothetical protein SD1D_0478 [Herbinix luporum]
MFKTEKSRLVILILTIITLLITVIGIIFEYLFPKFIEYKYQIKTENPASIGIIGGADGPTSIFISGTKSGNVLTIICGLVSAAGIIYLLFTKKKRIQK